MPSLQFAYQANQARAAFQFLLRELPKIKAAQNFARLQNQV
jgi:hypothetical protein